MVAQVAILILLISVILLEREKEEAHTRFAENGNQRLEGFPIIGAGLIGIWL